MRRFSLLVLSLVLALGCGKKPPAPPPDDGGETDTTDPGETEPGQKEKLLADLKSRRPEAQREAADALAALAQSDPTVIDALVELLNDKTTAGPGKTFPTQVSSTREAAAVALMRCGPKGEEALRDRGVPILRDGLTDKDAAVREHTAYTLGVIGPLMKPLALSLQRACTDADPKVRAAAFDALRTVGVADMSLLAGLLTHKDPDIRRSAAELIASLPEVSGDAVPSLTRALDDPDEVIRFAAAAGIATAAPKGATEPTAEKVVATIDKAYPPVFDPKAFNPMMPEEVYWRALTKMGKVAVRPVTTLLTHKNPLVRALALRTLGDIGPESKAVADKVKDALTDPDVGLEAASTLFRIGIDDPEAGSLVKAALASTSPGVAYVAVIAIMRMGPAGKPFVPLALEKLASPQADARYAAVYLVGTLEPSEAAKSIPPLAKLATDPEPLIRREVGAVLEKLGPVAAPAADALAKALPAKKDEVVKGQFVDALVAMAPTSGPAAAALVPLAHDPNYSTAVRVKVIAALATADPTSKDVAAVLVKAATEKDEAIRAAAAGAIGKLNPLPSEALAVLVKLAKADPRLTVRLAAVRAIAALGPRAKAAQGDLEAMTSEKMPGLVLWAQVALAAVNGDVTKAAGTIRSGLGDRRQDVRTAAAEALALVGPTPEDVPALVKLLKESAGAKAAAAAALGRVGAPAKAAVPLLANLLSDRDSEVRIAAAEALGRIGPAAMPAAPKLREAINDPLVAPTARKAMDRIGIKDDGPKR